MIRMNPHYQKLAAGYLFSNIAEKVNAHTANNPDTDIIKLGIGDVTLSLPEACVEAMKGAADELSSEKGFRGYGPERGYDFLRKAIADNDYNGLGIDPGEVFVSDGAKCDMGNFLDILAADISVAVPDPVYPVYVDTNVMAGKTGEFHHGRYDGLHYLEGTPENGFVPLPPDQPVDLIYLCFPNNPTGATATKEQLKLWVDYARGNGALILFDAAYERFISDSALPHSIYEVEGARECAVEFRSFSKTAGFTGTRCAFTVVPEDVRVGGPDGKMHALHGLWNRRQSTKFNGVSYPVQRAAEAVYTREGAREVDERIRYYMKNARMIREAMTEAGYVCTGGEHSPYVWVKTGTDSWSFFDKLLEEASVVITPGVGFGRMGQGFIRISGFNHHENVERALKRIRKIL
ncbi:MAG: LL-diaminopimelate aminotransferase [Spirochaetota bacterium]